MIENTATLEQIQEARDAQLRSEAAFAAFELEQNHSKRIAVINWLSAADADADQVAFSAARQDIPDTGRWILEHPNIKSWLDRTKSTAPTVWLNGKPGAGESFRFILKLSTGPKSMIVTNFEYVLRCYRKNNLGFSGH